MVTKSPYIPQPRATIPAPKMPLTVTPSALQAQNLPDPKIDDPFHDQEIKKGPLGIQDEILYKKRAAPNAGTILETTGPLLHTEKVKKTVIYKEGLTDATTDKKESDINPDAKLPDTDAKSGSTAPVAKLPDTDANAGSTAPVANSKNSNTGIPGIWIGTPGSIVAGAHLEYVGVFAALHLILYFATGLSTQGAGRIIDAMFVIVLAGTGLYTWSNVDSVAESLKRWAMKTYNEVTAWQSVIVFLVAFYLVVYILGIPMVEGKPVTISVIENGSIVFVVTQLIYIALKYWFDVDVLSDLFLSFPQESSPHVKVDGGEKGVTLPPVPVKEKAPEKEVYNVANNNYSYTEAKAVCQAYDARLATYNEIEQAYEKGGEWCNYGWSDDQMIYFPTQKSTWQDLQKDPAKKHSCGRPGVNGGFMANPDLKFGVNCFGVKPKFTQGTDVQQTATATTVPTADPAVAVAVAAIKGTPVPINSFNRTGWSEYA